MAYRGEAAYCGENIRKREKNLKEKRIIGEINPNSQVKN